MGLLNNALDLALLMCTCSGLMFAFLCIKKLNQKFYFIPLIVGLVAGIVYLLTFNLEYQLEYGFLITLSSIYTGLTTAQILISILISLLKDKKKYPFPNV